MIKNFLYNKVLCVILLSLSFLVGQTQVSTSVFWDKDKFNALPENVKNVLKPEMDQMTKDFTQFSKELILIASPEYWKQSLTYQDFRNGESVKSYGNYTSSSITVTSHGSDRNPLSPMGAWISFAEQSYGIDNRSFPIKGEIVENKTTTWDEFVEYHGGSLEMIKKNINEDDFKKYNLEGRLVSFRIKGENTFEAKITYYFKNKDGKYKQASKKNSPKQCEYYNTDCKSKIVTGTYKFPEFDFHDIYKLGRKECCGSGWDVYDNALNALHEGKYQYSLQQQYQKDGRIVQPWTWNYEFPFDTKDLENFNIKFNFDDQTIESFEFNMAYLSSGFWKIAYLNAEAARRMATDLKRKDSWISKQIK